MRQTEPHPPETELRTAAVDLHQRHIGCDLAALGQHLAVDQQQPLGWIVRVDTAADSQRRNLATDVDGKLVEQWGHCCRSGCSDGGHG